MEEMGSLKTLKNEKFLNGLMEDENGNIILEVTESDKGTTRNENNDKVQSIKKLANDIKASINPLVPDFH